MSDDMGLVFKALRYSAEKHNDQRRKDSRSSPYINHPIQVADTLWQVGGVRDAAVLAAAILHDTIEDTDATPAEIEREFGRDVLGLVMEVTDDRSLPQPVRKQLQIEHAAGLSTRAKLIKLADKLCNISDIIKFPPDDWSSQRKQEYLLWTEKVVQGLRGANKALEEQYDKALRKGKHELGASETDR